MALIEFRRAREPAGRWKDGQLQPEPPPPPPPEASAASADPGAAARSFYESLFTESGGAEPASEPPSPAHFCRSCGASFRDSPARHRRSTAHLLGLPAAPGSGSGWVPGPGSGSGACSGPGYRLLLRAGWAGGGLGPAGRGRLLPVPTELKRDRAGLGWARGRHRNRARISHFGPGDTAAVAGPNRKQNRARFGSEAGPDRGQHRERDRARFGTEEAERGWEIWMRREWEREEAPENPLRHLREHRDHRDPQNPARDPFRDIGTPPRPPGPP
ncbi:G patch domain and ankyrin repeat-containing protein 1 [Zonotrichia leucophrys gambelii]|uniref:G patch domain and ankyrin repeat-containing protein 1 n=1 Tax=Zonotrichia leucophrys gambelii TaxID=257770 RepID=UPI0031400D71